MLLIKNTPFLFYKQNFTTIGESHQYHLIYWGKIFFENGSVIALPKTRAKTLAASNSTQELSRIIFPLVVPLLPKEDEDEESDDD